MKNFNFNEVISKCKKLLNNKTFQFLSISLVVSASIALIVTLSLYGTIPCQLIKCHEHAYVCKNHPFYAECICDEGYQGDGRYNCDLCGLVYTGSNLNLRIVGGNTSLAHSWPSAVLIKINYKLDTYVTGSKLTIKATFTCGGTLINRYTVLTAAHCIPTSFEYYANSQYYTIPVETNQYYGSKESMFTVYLGVHNQTLISDGIVQSSYVNKLTIHESYDTSSSLNDIATLKLSTSMNLNSYIQIACVPTSNYSLTYPEADTYALIIGWGATKTFGSANDVLKNAKIYVYNSTTCSNVQITKTKNWSSQICAGNTTGYTDVCTGDSGGSLWSTGTVLNTTRYISAGIVSYGSACGIPNYAGIYTRTSYYVDWLYTNSRL